MAEQDPQHDLDLILYVLENPIRRRILRKLARENNYPLQLSKELNVSQQAIMKHLKVLEESDFVVSYEEPSKKGGPPRRVFSPRKRYCIRIDIGPNTYSEEIRSYRDYEIRTVESETVGGAQHLKLEISGKVTGEIRSEVAGSLPAFIDPVLERIRLDLGTVILKGDLTEKSRGLSKLSHDIGQEITRVEERRRRLIALKERTNEEVNKLIGLLSGNPKNRDILLFLLAIGGDREIDAVESFEIRGKPQNDTKGPIRKTMSKM